ncbi:MAG: helix-turn-helix transcriptional regulator [Anaerolineae bacterium]|nr:helix-turn-helix transcriptional regulator [Anaerolineae bacterium]
MRNNIIGPRVRLARQEKTPPLTQEALATALQLAGWDISRSGVAKIELGMRQVTDVEIAKLARVLDVPIQWLFDCSEEG